MKFINDLISCKDRVMYILENWEDTRDSDKLLYLAYMNLFHNLREDITCSDNPYKILKERTMEAYSFDTIRRNRQLIQAKGLFQGKHRKEKEAEGEITRNTIHSVPVGTTAENDQPVQISLNYFEGGSE